MASLLSDVRLAARHLLRTPGFALVTILTLALGIGANTAIFSVVNGVILRPLGYPDPDRLMFITSRFPSMGFEQFWVSPPEYFELQEMSQSFAVIGAFGTGEANVTTGERPRRVRTATVDADLMRALAVQPQQGRLFAANETRLNGPQLAILSHELWQSALSGRPTIGQTLEIDGVKREIIGIMPPGADVMDNKTEIWLPGNLDPSNRTNRSSHFLYLIGRLKDGVTVAQARAELDKLLTDWDAKFKGRHSPNPRNHQMQLEPVQDEIVGSARRAIWVLQAAVGFVLLIACANLANLLLARAETRHREFAVRTALGAGRWRLLRQFMTEGILLSLLGGVLGLGVAIAGLRALLAIYPESLPRSASVSLDPSVLLFTLAVSILTGIVFGFAPLLHTSTGSLATSLKEGGGRGATGAARHHVRRALVMAEVALAVVLVVGAGLMLQTVWNLTTVDAGFDRSRLLTFGLQLPRANYENVTSRAAFYQRLLERLRQTPGVQGATAMSGLPPNRDVNANDTEIDNFEPKPEGPYENVDYYQNVMTDYFETMGIPIVRGRAFQATDTGGAPVAVVNETLVKTFWPDLNPIGQRLRPDGPDGVPWFTVIGVAKDVKQGGVDQKTGTELYFLVDQLASQPRGFAPLAMNLVLRTNLPTTALASTIESVVREADASLPVVRLRDMEEVFAESIRRPRLLAHLLGAFAALALLLAAIGTYGVLSYMVTERRREIGIRMALGAEQGSVLGLVMGQGLRLTGVGLVVGFVSAYLLTALMTSLLYGVRPTDPSTLAAVGACIIIVAAIACYLPAYRASRVDPIVVLRDE
jgi:predicted permease